MVPSIVVFVIALAIVLLAVKLLGKSIKILWGILINALAGFIVLFVLRFLGIGVEITPLSSVIVGLLGLPGLVIVLIMQLKLGIN